MNVKRNKMFRIVPSPIHVVLSAFVTYNFLRDFFGIYFISLTRICRRGSRCSYLSMYSRYQSSCLRRERERETYESPLISI